MYIKEYCLTSELLGFYSHTKKRLDIAHKIILRRQWNKKRRRTYRKKLVGCENENKNYQQDTFALIIGLPVVKLQLHLSVQLRSMYKYLDFNIRFSYRHISSEPFSIIMERNFINEVQETNIMKPKIILFGLRSIVLNCDD